MRDNFADALARVLKHEGGFVNHPRDPGGATNKGVTLATFRRYVDPHGTVEDLKAISVADVAKVYRKGYWDAVEADELPFGVDYAVFDFAVNSGPGTAVKFLQKVVGATIDTRIGPQTIAAVNAMEPRDVINGLARERLAYLKRLKTWATFGKGWERRVQGMREDALQMATLNTKTTPKPISDDGWTTEMNPREPASDLPKGNSAALIVAAAVAAASAITWAVMAARDWLMGLFS